MSLTVVCDSSGCCGIKHIRNFYGEPGDAYRYSLITHTGHVEDTHSTTPSAYQMVLKISQADIDSLGSYFTWGDVFDLYLKNLFAQRPAGMVTVNLAEEPPRESECDCCFDEEGDSLLVDAWRPFLTERGFKEVTFVNSNSGNIIHHFTLIYG